jgi:hypothetical protein
MVEHRSVLVRADLTHSMYGAEGERSSFVEAIDVSEGLVVHRVAVCGRPLTEERGCFDNRSAVAFASSGLPGGLGLAPFWGASLPRSGTVSTDVYADQGPGTATYEVKPAREEADCSVIDLSNHLHRSTDFPLTVDRATICGDSSFPASFLEEDGTRYVRTSVAKGDDPVPASGSSAWGSDDRAIPLRGWSAPVVVHDDSDPTPLTAREAHEVASEDREPYRRFFEENPDAVVLSSTFETEIKYSVRLASARKAPMKKPVSLSSGNCSGKPFVPCTG